MPNLLVVNYGKVSQMQHKIKKAVFPIAGLGTRFLPATKAMPKEMLPIVDKPLIQYAVEEAIEAGIEQMIFVTSSTKRPVEDHFDRNVELEQLLEKTNKQQLLAHLNLPSHITITYVRQHEPLGLGHAVSCAKHLIHDEPFAILLADDLMYNDAPRCLAQMTRYFNTHDIDGMLGIEAIEPRESDKYGIVAMDAHCRVHRVVEKPTPENAPSHLAIVGRYILPSQIFNYLDQATPSVGNEIQLTDAIEKLLMDKHISGFAFDGKRYDCGSKLGYAQATYEYALRHHEIGERFGAWIEACTTHHV